ncbi:MAG: hypothetical protein PHG41_01990 [Actinomycetota bacterium]|nr:hypothetical protein [Actinomycetota bacterium]
MSFSCTKEPLFGELTVCGKIDGTTFAPLEIKDSFSIDKDKIFAVVEVSGAKTGDTWKFVWTNEDTEEIIAESTGKFSESRWGYVEGYLSNCLTQSDDSDIIGEPGNYRVDFYYNEQLIKSAYFIIEVPSTKIIGVILSRRIDESGQPLDVTKNFYPDDAIYAMVGLNYQIDGETVGIKWYKGESELIGEEEFNIDKNNYIPGYITFKIVNDQLWPIGSYKIEVYHNGVLEDSFYFNIVKKDIPDVTFNDNNIYKTEKFNFSISYPDGWDYKEEESDRGLEVIFRPVLLPEGVNVTININVLRKGYYPSRKEYYNFSKRVLEEAIDLTNNIEIKTEESTIEINGINYDKISYHYLLDSGKSWYIDFVFLNENDLLYLPVKISDVYYKEFSDRLFDFMLQSLSVE